MIPALTIRQIKYFVAVFESGSISKAAERENCSQPGLSAQVRNLEQIIGSPLFDRSVTGIAPTAAGQRFYRHAVVILHAINRVEQEMTDYGREASGIVRVGLIPSIVRGLLPEFLPEFVENHPFVDIQLVESFSGILADWVFEDKIDFAVVVEPPRHTGMKVRKLADGLAVLISGRALDLPPLVPVRLPELTSLKLVAPSPRHSLHDVIDRAIRTGNLRIKRTIELDTVTGMIEFVRRSDWVTILPLAAVVADLNSDQLRVNPIIEPAIVTDLYLIHLQQNPLSRAAKTFVVALKAKMDAVSDIWAAALKTAPESRRSRRTRDRRRA
jgi:LysR family nitrogen assimilation transcriptional regulator